MVYSVSIISHQLNNNKVEYTVSITASSSSTTKYVKYRYSQLKDIHDRLQEMSTRLNLEIQLPEFPKRKLFGVTNKSEQSILQRREELENYLSQLIRIQKLYASEIFRLSFLPQEIESSFCNSQINAKMSINKYTIISEVVIYFATIKDNETKEEWNIEFRYSDLRNIHKSLEKDKVNYLPDFPQRKVFGTTIDKPEDIRRRMEKLQKYFNKVLNSKQLKRNPIIKYFLQSSKKEAQKKNNTKY